MNLLFLDAYFEPESTAFTHLEHDLIEALVDAGHEIFVVCPIPTRGIDEETRNKYCKIKQEELCEGHIHVTRFWAPKEGKNPVIRAFRYFWCNIRTYVIGKKVKNIDVVFSNSTPPTQGMLSALVAKKLSKRYKHHVPFVYNLQDIFPDSLVNAGMTNKGSIIWKIGRKIEDYTYRNADKIIVISEGFKKNIMAKGVPEEKIAVVPNWVNTDNVFPVKREDNKLFDKFGLDRNKFYICYSGNIGHSQNLELIIEVAQAIKDTMPDVVFVFIGEGAAKEQFEKTIQNEPLDNIKVFPFQPYEDIANVFSLGDVGLIISKPGIGGSSVPSKTWSIMAAERPVLASFDKDSELVSLIDTVGCGVTAEAGNKNALIDAIRTLKMNSDLAEISKRGRTYLSTELDKEKCVGEYVETIKSIQ